MTHRAMAARQPPGRRAAARSCAVLLGLALLPAAAMSESPSPAVALGPDARRPLVIAHRGASGERPEHTLAAYRLAIAQGADFIEPDLVPTRDGHLIARHENELSGTTDVADHPAFADRRTTKQIDGEPVSGWFSEDFSLAEIRRLRARERIPQIRPANTAFDGEDGIPTLTEIIALLRETEAAGRRVGIYPETKHPTFFASEGRHLDGTPIARSLGTMLVDTLVTEGFTEPGRVFIQSFELGNLLELASSIMPARGVDLPLVLLFGELRPAPPHGSFSQPYDFSAAALAGTEPQVRYPGLAAVLDQPLDPAVGYAQLAAPAALRWLRANGIDAIGPWKDSLLPRRPILPPPGDPLAPRQRLLGSLHPLLADASAAGLGVHPYTLRAEPAFLAEQPDGRPQSMEDELKRLLDAGASGFFTDHPARGVAARDGWLRARP